MIKKAEHDKAADAIYIYITDAPVEYTKQIDELRYVDYDADGMPVGVELLCVSNGVIPNDLPNRTEIERYLEKEGIKVFA
jgi:uncharacterized protein YuzE